MPVQPLDWSCTRPSPSRRRAPMSLRQLDHRTLGDRPLRRGWTLNQTEPVRLTSTPQHCWTPRLRRSALPTPRRSHHSCQPPWPAARWRRFGPSVMRWPQYLRTRQWCPARLDGDRRNRTTPTRARTLRRRHGSVREMLGRTRRLISTAGARDTGSLAAPGAIASIFEEVPSGFSPAAEERSLL